ncbi:MAG: BREX-1 system phosphatase PglZ type B [Deltaproteobacteria bacterium]|nr:BREX-1 system phosphatase PglZ type B [Candidatus Tharpella aukensis]
MSRVIDHLLKAIRAAAVHNPEVQVAPACILWPDRDRQWEVALPLLQAELPELLILGDYKPEKCTGPAIWLRCVIAGKVEDVSLPQDRPPILYLPGVSRQDLRAIEDCPDHLKPLAELQYRGTIWSQINGKDWTILAYLKSDQGGLGVDVAADNDTKAALPPAFGRLLDEEIKSLHGKRLDRDYFNTLLTSGDPVRDLLKWLDRGESFKEACDDNQWRAFVELCKSQLDYNPQDEGQLEGAARLAAHSGSWSAVWERYCEAPKRYPAIPELIRRCQPPSQSLLWRLNDGAFAGWPQWNDDQEAVLRQELTDLESLTPEIARKKIDNLEAQHGQRRSLVWAELGDASLARALAPLAELAEVAGKTLAAGSIDDMVKAYSDYGWRVDDALLKTLALIDKPNDFAAVESAIRVLYLPWAEAAARYLQDLVDNSSYPGKTILEVTPVVGQAGTCRLFVDGLRFDLAQRLLVILQEGGCQVEVTPYWVPLPSLTATGKPAVAPLFGSAKVSEPGAGYAFEPITAHFLKKSIGENGWQILGPGESGDSQGQAWSEYGDIDHEGHHQGWKMARHLDDLLQDICDRILALLKAGWERVQVVTDHGWLLLPGGLPKIGLAACLAENKWGRCASLKDGAQTDERLYPWFWNPDQLVALADGISCYKAGQEYAHGGLSLQESLTLQLTVTGAETKAAVQVKVTQIKWVGLRCRVTIDRDEIFLRLDLRRHAADATSSLVSNINEFDDGRASIVVENEDFFGESASLVLLAEDDTVISQVTTIIGGEER